MFTGCMGDDNFQPKRKGYFRIAFPDKQYTEYNSGCPFSFEYPTYANVAKDSEQDSQPCWLNVVYPKFKGKLYLSYKMVNGNLNEYLEECRTFAVKHEIKASAINEREVANAKEKVYGLIYDIEGNAASNMQFYLTDSTKNFIRGALYFYSVPNKDSLEPVLAFIKQDIYHMVETFRWKDGSK
jgi:gliding motility-associated lipoprotein GldD